MYTTGNQPNSSGIGKVDEARNFAPLLHETAIWRGFYGFTMRALEPIRAVRYRHETDCILVSSWAEISSCWGGSYTFGIYAFMPVSGLAKVLDLALTSSPASYSVSHPPLRSFRSFGSVNLTSFAFYIHSFLSTFDFFIALLLLRLIRPVLFTLK